MSTSNYQTNTGHRFISKGKTAYKIHIHTPEDKVLHRSVGYIKLGENEGLKKAIRLRNELGKEMWGPHWRLVLNQPSIFTKLPHSLEPKLIYKGNNKKPYYIAQWTEYDEDGNQNLRSLLGNIEHMGKLAAYNKCKKKLLKVYKPYFGILQHMGRFNIVKHL